MIVLRSAAPAEPHILISEELFTTMTDQEDNPLSLRSYARRRLVAALTPVSHLQQVPYSVPSSPVRVTTTDAVTIKGTLLARGRRSAVVVCHGFGSTHRSVPMVWLAEALYEHWDVLAFDWRGYGRSGGLSSMGGIEALDLQAVISFARAQGYAQVGIVGESMCGLILLAAQGLAPGLADAIATISAPADYALVGWPRPQIVQHVAPREMLRPVARLLGFRLGALALPQPLDVVGTIGVPLLLIHGETDRTVPVANAYALHRHAPQARLRIYAGIGHAVVSMRAQAPQRLLDDLRAHFAVLPE
jgi:pimeloyl-ACP methyl ester carboxylesterase